MRYFFHISEFGHEGFRYLPGLAAVSDDLVLWAPAGAQIEEAKSAGASVLGAEDVLALVAANRARIVGRQHWLTEKSSRDGGWKLARWSDGFDGEIARIAEADMDKPEDQRRVFFAADEKGHDWARQEVESGSPRAALVEQMISKPGALDPAQTDLLPGMAEKLARIDSADERLLLALRDIRNHTLAGQEVGADIAVEPEGFLEVVGASTRAGPWPDAPPALPTIEAVTEVLQTVISLAPIGDASDLDEFLSLNQLATIRRLIDELLLFHAHPRQSLESELAAAAELEKWWRDILKPPDLPLSVVFGLVGAVLALLGEPLAAVAVSAPVPAARLGYGIYRGVNRRRAQGQDDDVEPARYDGSRLPFILAYGSGSVTYDRIGEVRRRLQQFGA